MTGWALVLGGGGLAGIAWETGVLADAGADVAADFLLGTSAGATVAAQVGSGVPAAELLARQVEPARQAAELVPDPAGVAALMESWETMAVVAVDAHSGEPRVFDRASGVDLIDAVAASCAVPGIWPPVTIGGRRLTGVSGPRSTPTWPPASGRC